MVLLGCWNAVARYLGRYYGHSLSSNALLEAQSHMFAVVFLLGGAYTLQRNEHVRVDVLYSRLSKRGRAIVDVLGTACLLVPFCAFGVWSSWPGVLESIRVREISPDPGGLPRYPIKMLVPVSFVLLALQGLSSFARSIRTMSDPEHRE
jgi:TRAP-type mannitol/chloroaromatic compound transport system permease small subunit